MKIEGEYKLNWLDKLEKKLGRFAIPNLTVYLLAGLAAINIIKAVWVCDRFRYLLFSTGTFRMAYTGTGIYFKRTDLEDYFLGIDPTNRKFDFFTVSSIIVLFSWFCT